MTKLIHIVTILIFILTGCSDKKLINEQLTDAERLTAEHPDSAVAILADIDTTIMSENQKARHELLYCYGNLIHGRPFTLDSNKISGTDKVFGNKFDSDKVKWLILKSAHANQSGNTVARLEYLKDAEFLAIQTEDRFDLGIVYLLLAKIYEQGFNGTVSKYYAEKSADIFRTLRCPTHLRNSRMAIVGAYCAQRDYRSMLDSLLALEDDVMANATDSYKIYFLDQLARTYDANGQTERAIEIWHKLYDGETASSNTLAHWADAYIRINEPDSAYALIERANDLPHNHSDEYLCRNVEYSILEKLGQDSRLARIDSLRSIALDQIFKDRKLEESSLALNIKYDTAARKAWIDAAEARNRTNMTIFLAALTAITAVAALVLLRKRNQTLRLRHENDILKIRTLESDLFETDNRNKEIASRISGLFHSRFKLLDGLASSFFECRETGHEQKKIYSEVKKSITEFRSEHAVRELEHLVDCHNNDLMKRFHEDFPSLSVAQYRLALYLFCGFSLPAISIFTDSELRNIYVYKSRLKSIIINSACPRKDDYLEYF